MESLFKVGKKRNNLQNLVPIILIETDLDGF